MKRELFAKARRCGSWFNRSHNHLSKNISNIFCYVRRVLKSPPLALGLVRSEADGPRVGLGPVLIW